MASRAQVAILQGSMSVGALLLATMTGWSCGYDFDAAFSDSPSTDGGHEHDAAGGTGGMEAGGTGGTPTGGTGGAGGTGGTAMGGTGGTPNGGTGGTSGSEDCTNGTDDNGNGLVDCADPQCAPDYQCEIAPPSGWSNVGYKAERSVTAPAADCSGFDALEFTRNLVAPTTGCNCSCSGPTNQACATTVSRIWGNANCIGSSADVNFGTCEQYPSDWVVASVRGGSFTYTQGTCSPGSSGAPSAATWTDAVDVCLVNEHGGGCASGSVCVKKPTTAVNPAACVHQPGNVPCPSAYPQHDVYYDGIEDGRTCSDSACSCGTANGSCAPTVVLYGNTSCTGSPTSTYELDGYCRNTGFAVGDIRSGFVMSNIDVGTCPSSGTGMTGSATPTAPHTVCCVAP